MAILFYFSLQLNCGLEAASQPCKKEFGTVKTWDTKATSKIKGLHTLFRFEHLNEHLQANLNLIA